MKRNYKKIILKLLSLILCFSLTTLAFASEKNYDIKIGENYNSPDLDFEYTIDNELVPIEEFIQSENNILINENDMEDAFEIVNITVSEEYEIETTGSRSVLPDIHVKNLKSSITEPFKVGYDVIFQVSVENIGDTAAANIPLAVIVDNNTLGTHNCGTINPGMGINVEISIRANFAGVYTLNLIANSNQTILESNYDNNAVVSTYRWAGYDGLAAYEFFAADNNHTFPINTRKVFNYGIANFGTTDITMVTVGYLVDLEMQASWVASYIPAGYVLTGTLTLSVPTAGRKNIGILVDPFNEKPDPSRSDNMLTRTITTIDVNMMYTNNRETISEYMIATEHGITVLTFTCDWGEEYFISDGNAVFPKRSAYVSAVSTRPSFDTPYTINVGSAVHKSSTGDVLRVFNMEPSSVIIPSGLFYYYARENSDSVTYPRNNGNFGSIFVTIYGGAFGPTSFEHTASLNV